MAVPLGVSVLLISNMAPLSATTAPTTEPTHFWTTPPAMNGTTRAPLPKAGASPVSPTAASSTYGYYESLYHLPNYSPMSSFVYNMNGNDTQIPTLASSAAEPFAVYYVDTASNLDALYLNNSTVRALAHIIPLYQRFGYNGMLDNEFFVEDGYDEALFFGTTTTTITTYSLETVNLTTGSTLMWNTTFAIDGTNQEPIYVGNNTILVLSSNNSIYGFNLASHREWSAGRTKFFEANNVYWIPQLQQLLSVEAQGSSGDAVQQLNASDTPLGQVKLTSVTTVTVDSGVRFNFVNGLGYNASSRQIAFTAGYYRQSTVDTFVLQYTSSYVLSGTVTARYTVEPGNYPRIFTGQRYAYTSEYVLGGDLGRTQYLLESLDGRDGAHEPVVPAGHRLRERLFRGALCPESELHARLQRVVEE